HVTPGFSALNAPSTGQQFIIINNDGVDAIAGTFAGLPDNSTLTANNLQFRIDYDSGTGNDVMLTLTNVAISSAGAAVTTGNGNNVVDPSECNLLSIVITNSAGDTTTNIQATLISETAGIVVTQPFSGYPNI